MKVEQGGKSRSGPVWRRGVCKEYSAHGISSALDVEPELHDVALLDHILLALKSQQAALLGHVEAARVDEVGVRHRLGTDEALLKVCSGRRREEGRWAVGYGRSRGQEVRRRPAAKGLLVPCSRNGPDSAAHEQAYRGPSGEEPLPPAPAPHLCE